MALNEKDINRVKGSGFLHNRGTETFSARVVNKNGTLTVEQLQTDRKSTRLNSSHTS